MKISVIIPLYNAEPHIKQCIESLFNQSYKNYELIIINDGSTDHSLEIAQKCIKRLKNAHIYSQNNQGVSSARNLGISKAKGKYITFIDSDDWVEPFYLENLIIHTINNDIDFIISGLFNFHETNQIDYIQLANSGILNFDNPRDLVKMMKTQLMTSPVGKIYKKSIIDKNKIFFNQKISYAEDKEFNLTYMKYANYGCSVSYIGYHYRRDTIGSLSKIQHKNIFDNSCRQWKILKDIFYSRGFQNIKFVNKFLVNELFNLINDHIYISAKNKTKIDATTFIEYKYLRKHFHLIDDKIWKIILIIYGQLHIIRIIYRFFLIR